MRAIHKRVEHWQGLPFGTLAEAAEFLGEVESKVKPAHEVASSASVSTADQEFRELTMDDLRELSKVVPLEAVQWVVAYCERDGKQAVRVGLTLRARPRSSTELEVKGDEEVVVEGLFVGTKKKLDSRFAAMRDALELALAKGDPPQPRASWRRWLNHPWPIQVLGGAVGALIAAGVVFLLSH